MVTLPTKNLRDNIGIDSFERLILFSALLLREAYNDVSNNDAIRDYVKLSIKEQIVRNTDNRFYKQGIIQIDGRFEYNASLYNLGGGFLDSTLELVTGFGLYSGQNLNPSEDIVAPIEDDDPSVNTLEKLFVWASLEYQRILNLVPTSDAATLGQVSFKPRLQGTGDRPNFNIKATVEFSLNTFAETNFLLGSVGFNDNTVLPTFGAQIRSDRQFSSTYQIRSFS